MLTKAIVVFIVCAVAIGLVGNSYAHKAEVIGDYKIEVGWKNEPPIIGQKNSIEVIVTVATEHDKESHESEEHETEHMEDEKEMEHDESIEHEGMTHEEHEEEMKMTEEEHDEEMDHEVHLEPGTAVSGLSENLEAIVTLNGKKTSLVLTESSKAGIYHADYTPADVGFPSVSLVGKIGNKEFEITFHPEKVEDLSMLSPLKQIDFGISPNDVKCKSEMILIINNFDGRPACVSSSGAEKLEALGWGTIA